jgi:hypothetical protein
MRLILMGLGIASVTAGVAMLGFGTSYNEFGIGKSLIQAGTTAVIGGFVIVGLAVALGQLTRIAKGLDEPRPGGAPTWKIAIVLPTALGDAVVPRVAGGPQVVTIFKSGVIDDMAYTLQRRIDRSRRAAGDHAFRTLASDELSVLLENPCTARTR